MSLRGACALAVAGILAVACAGGAAGPAQQVTAHFPQAAQLFVGSEVRVLGVQVGEVTAITPEGKTVRVDMTVDADRPLPADVRAALTPVALLGERFIALEPAYAGGPQLALGAVIGVDRTSVPAEVDEVLRSFQSFASALDEAALARLIDTAAETFQGQGSGLNTLLDQGAQTVEILDDASADLNGLVSELGALNATLATRDEQIGRTLEHLSTVLQTFAAERDDIIGSVRELARLLDELRPLVDEHTEPLVRDLDRLTTSLSTVDRNMDGVTETFGATNRLFNGAERAADFRNGQVRLDNEGEQVADAIQIRTTQRLAGVCLRLDVEACADPAFWEPLVPEISCLSSGDCARGETSVAEALAAAFTHLPAPARAALAESARARQRREPGTQEDARAGPDRDDEAAEDRLVPLPLPDPRLDVLRGETAPLP